MHATIRMLILAVETVSSLITMTSSAAEPAPAARAASASAPAPGAPLYLLTYDHGGLVLWGPDHFAERLRNAVSWLDKYPGFKIGLDNEAHTYDALAQENPQLLEEIRGYLKRYA